MKKQECHLKDSELAEIYTMDNQLALMEHIKDCPFCSERLVKSLSASAKTMVHAPHYLKQKILVKKQYMKQKKQEFTIYCIKISLAVAASLAIIFLSDITESFSSFDLRPSEIRTVPETAPKPKRDLSLEIYRGTDVINQKIINFTDSLAHITI